jgi:hypothetical protein
LNTAGLLRGRTGTAKQLGAIRHLTCKNLQNLPASPTSLKL